MPFLVRTILVALALAVATMVAGAAIQPIFGDLGIPAPESNPLPWQIASWLVLAATLVWFATRSRVTGWRLAASLAVLLYGICHFNSLIEARFFGLFSSRQYTAIMLMMTVSTVLFALALVPILRGLTPRAASADWESRVSLLRLAAGAAGYLIAYFVAGILVFPFVSSFYAQRPMPNGLEVIAMQLLIRGPVFVALMLLLVRMSGASRRETILMTGGALSLMGGVAMLMVPNSFIPDAARWAHFVEVVSSNLLFGCFVGWLLTSKRTPSAAVAPAVAPA